MKNDEENNSTRISHRELWINTQYFIEAIRCVCSLLYLWENISVCEFIDAHDFVDGKLHRFYINLCALVDIHCTISKSKSERVKYKKELKTMCPSFNWIFYERDKNAAHKDSDYIANQNYTPDEMAKKMKQAVDDVKNICANIISSEVGICYYKYDPLLFRYINGITPEIEKMLNERIYSQENHMANDHIYKVISETRQARTLVDTANYCVNGKNGLMGQPYDMLQCRQNLCILLNATFGTDMWVEIKDDIVTRDECLNLIKEVLKRHENNSH